MKDVIVEHLIRNSFIRSSPLGFTAGRSCLTNLLEYMEELTNLVDMFYLLMVKLRGARLHGQIDQFGWMSGCQIGSRTVVSFSLV